MILMKIFCVKSDGFLKKCGPKVRPFGGRYERKSCSASTYDVSIKPKERTVKNMCMCMFTYIDILFNIISVNNPNIE